MEKLISNILGIPEDKVIKLESYTLVDSIVSLPRFRKCISDKVWYDVVDRKSRISELYVNKFKDLFNDSLRRRLCDLLEKEVPHLRITFYKDVYLYTRMGDKIIFTKICIVDKEFAKYEESFDKALPSVLNIMAGEGTYFNIVE